MAAPERFAETSDSSCIAGAVHTWHEAADHILICEGRFRGEADKQGRVASTAWVEDAE
jgi:hypothetical protein